jgi:hypothetical protein
LWCESYARNLSKCRSITSGRLSIQTDVSSHVARSLALELIPSVVAPAVSSTLDAVGHESYLKRRYHWNNRGEEGLDDALTYSTRVVTRQPRFDAGYAAIARVGITSLTLDPELPEAPYPILNSDWESAEAPCLPPLDAPASQRPRRRRGRDQRVHRNPATLVAPTVSTPGTKPVS